jgi:hypothetical protein
VCGARTAQGMPRWDRGRTPRGDECSFRTTKRPLIAEAIKGLFRSMGSVRAPRCSYRESFGWRARVHVPLIALQPFTCSLLRKSPPEAPTWRSALGRARPPHRRAATFLPMGDLKGHGDSVESYRRARGNTDRRHECRGRGLNRPRKKPESTPLPYGRGSVTHWIRMRAINPAYGRGSITRLHNWRLDRALNPHVRDQRRSLIARRWSRHST